MNTRRNSGKSLNKEAPGIISFGTAEQASRHSEMRQMLVECPIPDNELARNMALFLVPQTLSRVLFMDFLYRSTLDVQGVVMEFGCRWGQNVSLFGSMRGIYEPFNRLRKIVAFDTFSGFPSVDHKDGDLVAEGSYATTLGYEKYLDKIMRYIEADSPLAHLKKYEIVVGDVTETLPCYLNQHPSTVISLAYFDLDVYKPTISCLRAIRGRVTKGTIIGFDEVNDETTPGETIALIEELGLQNIRLKRWPWNSRTSYFVVE